MIESGKYGAISQPRILHIITNDYSGRMIKDLAKGYLETGNPIAIFSIEKSVKPNWAGEFEVIDLSHLRVRGKNVFSNLISVLRCLVNYKPDLVVTHLFRASFLGVVSTRILSIPAIYTRHHISEHYEKGSFIHRYLDRLTGQLSQHVLVHSNAAKKWLVEVERIEPGKIQVLHQGFRFDDMNLSSHAKIYAKEILAAKGGKFNIVCATRYSPSKGQTYLLKAFREFHRKYPDSRLFFFGPGDSRWLENLVIDYELKHCVSVASKTSSILSIFSECDVVVHPSLVDSFSQLIVEVQSVGGLLVATDIAATREQIIDGKTGYIVDPRSSDDILKTLIYLYENPDLSSKIRLNAKKHARDKFSFDSYFMKLNEYYASCMN